MNIALPEKHSISLLVNNRPGVLIRIALTFSRRGYNLDSVVVSPAHHPEYSRMTIVAAGDPATLEQIIRQLNKLVDVIHAVDHTGENMIEREIALFKIACTSDNRIEVLRVASQFRCESLEQTQDAITLQATGTTDAINTIATMLEKFGIIESIRSGKLIMARGSTGT